MSQPTVGFAGMTHLGIVSATAVCARGFSTVCFDADAALIERLKRGELPVIEPDLDDLVRANGARQTFVSNVAALRACDVVYIAPDVPTDDAGNSDLSSINALIDSVAGSMRGDSVLVILCQVPPGFTRQISARLKTEQLYYQVETLIFGRAVERATKPERYIVGCADPRQPIDARFRALLAAFDCPILTMRYESAELAKIAINMCLVASIGVANTLAEICEGVSADWSEITPALKLDQRIGRFSYLAPGLGIAGGNLERDLATVIRLADAHKTDAGIVRAWQNNSRHRRDWAARTIRRVLLQSKPNATLAIWGLAYKENTHSVKNSPSIATIRQVGDVRLNVHDPIVPVSDAGHPRAEGFDDPLRALQGADALMILTPWPQYRAMAPAEIAARLAGRIVLDPYAVLDGEAARAAGLIHHTLGRPVEFAAS